MTNYHHIYHILILTKKPRTYKLYEEIKKKKAILVNSDIQAFYDMVKNLRAQFEYKDLCTNVGLVISPTIENNFTITTSIKLVVHSANYQQPVSFTCDCEYGIILIFFFILKQIITFLKMIFSEFKC